MTSLTTEEAEKLAKAWHDEFERWGTRAGPDRQSEITRDGVVVASVPTFHDSKVEMAYRRRIACAQAVVASKIVVPRRQITKQRDTLLPVLIERYRDVPDDFLQAVINGSKHSAEISVKVAAAILTVRNLYQKALTDA